MAEGEVQLGCEKCGKLGSTLIKCGKEDHLICQSCWTAAGNSCPLCGAKKAEAPDRSKE